MTDRSDPLDAPDPYPGVVSPEALRRMRKWNAKQEARWAEEAARKDARTFAGQIRLALNRKPFAPFTLRVGGTLKVAYTASDLENIRLLDDAIMWHDLEGTTYVVRFDQINWMTIDPVPVCP